MYRKILNINIRSITVNDLLQQLHKGIVFTPNVDHLVKLQTDDAFYACYKQADWIICDSKIVGIALKFLGNPIAEVIPGASLFKEFYTYHKKSSDIKIFLLGAAEGIAKEAQVNINRKVGREIVVGAHSPSYGFEKNDTECSEIIDLINNSGANVLVVGVGAPKQEKWIIKYKDKMPAINIFFALGATIDFEAGNIKRAPLIFQKLCLEWLFRLLKEPRRLWKRYLIDDLPFIGLVIKQKFKLYRNPFS